MTLSDEELRRRQEVDAPRWAMIAWLGVVVTGVTHTLRTRTLDHILVQSAPIGLALVAVLFVALAAIFIGERPRPSLSDVARHFVPGVVFFVMAAAAMVVGGTLLRPRRVGA